MISNNTEALKNLIVLPEIADQELLAQYYSLADVFVICSKRENFPTTCVEAQCCGTPVVGFDTGGTKETSVLTDKDFVEYGDLEGLKERIKERANYNGHEIASRACEVYSKESMTKNYLEVYDRCGKKERVMLIDVNYKSSSTGKIVYDLYNILRKQNKKVAICYGRGKNTQEENVLKIGYDLETLIHAGLARLTGYNGCFSPFSTRKLIRCIHAFKPDLLHIHEIHGYFVNQRPLIEYIKENRIPLIWTFHCEYMYTGKCGYTYECTNYQRGCGNCPSLKDYPKSLFFDKTKEMLEMKKRMLEDVGFLITTPSKWLASKVQSSFLKEKEIIVIHNGIDTSTFHPVDTNVLRERLSIPKDSKIVLSVAPDIMNERKGGKWVLRLAKMMKDENYYFVLIGDKSKNVNSMTRLNH